jgi:hypothetical protein
MNSTVSVSEPASVSSTTAPAPSILPALAALPVPLAPAPAGPAVPAVPLPPPKPPPTVRQGDVSKSIGKVDTLSQAEAELLHGYESTIKKSWQATLDVGLALVGIRDANLFRVDFDSFDDYYRVKWGFSCKQVYVWTNAAELFNAITEISELPVPNHESQLRPMFGLSKPEAQLAWRCAAIKSGGYPITERHVKSVLKDLQLKQKPVAPVRRINKAKQRKVVTDAIGELMILARQKAAYEVLIAKLEGLHREIQLLLTPTVSIKGRESGG